jgi:transcription elongation factor Elf1
MSDTKCPHCAAPADVVTTDEEGRLVCKACGKRLAFLVAPLRQQPSQGDAAPGQQSDETKRDDDDGRS